MALTFLQQLEEDLKRQQPAFRPTYEGLLSAPQAQIKTPETFQPGLLNQPSVAKTLGLLGLSFAPGAGISDYAGTYPSPQGGFEPGFEQNVQQGNYFTAGLQGLGAFGDMATAATAAMGPFALAGMGVGSIAKAPRAVQRGVEGLIDTVRPKLDDLGFFSQVEKSVMDIPQQKGTGQQFLAQIQKTPGVKPEELQYTGLDTFLANKPTVTKGEIQDYLDSNRVQVQEVQLRNANPYPYKTTDEFMSAISTAERKGNWDEVDRLTQAMESQAGVGGGGTTKYHLGAIEKIQTEIPGGTNYREVLLTLPAKQLPNKFTLRNNESGGTVGSFDTMEEAQEFMRTTPRQDIRGGNFSIQETTSGTEEVYRSSHFNQPNILAHMRINDRTIDGKPTMFIEEVQSDWHQAGRKHGYQGNNEFSRLEQKLSDLKAQKAELNKSAPPSDILYAGLEDALAGRPYTMPPEVDAFNEKLTALDNQISEVANQIYSMPRGVPDAPFKSTWDELSLKRAIKMASDEGYEQIAFTTGKTQAERYDLSKQVGRLVYNEKTQRLQGMSPDMKSTVVDKKVSPQELSDYVGKEVAEKLLQSPVNGPVGGMYQLDSNELTVGGEGMKGFYDKMLPKKLEKIGKKYGAKPTKTTMQTPDGEVEVWTFNLPKEMRETVKEQGQPLFQIGVGAAGLGTAGLLATEEEQY
jgi:polyhydroxyalkanoate synthesis regulator phasin